MSSVAAPEKKERLRLDIESHRHPSVAVVVPVTERPAPLDGLYREYAPALRAAGIDAQFIFVVHQAALHRARPLQDLHAAGEPIRVLEVGETVGESGMLAAAAANTDAPILLTLPAYRRVRPEVLPRLVDRVRNGVELATAVRDRKGDRWINRVQGRLFHLLVASSAGGRFRDMGCGVRALQRSMLASLPLYGDSFRFMPLLARNEGFVVAEVPAEQHPDDRRTRVYRPGIYMRRLVDILGFAFLHRFTQKPLRFFGLIGGISSLLGLLVLVVMLVQRFGGQALANRPLLLVGVLLCVLGWQTIALGLVGEIIVHLAAHRRPRYRVRSDTAVERTFPQSRDSQAS